MSKIEVIKSSWIVHISHGLSLIQQQIWNVLLSHAYDNLSVQNIHSIDIRILLFHLGNNRSLGYLQTILDGLCTIESFNLINKTKQVFARNKFKLLSSAVIEDGFCKYSFSNDLIPHLVNPPSYAKINLLIQKKFKSKYSLVIYELCVDYMHIGRTRAFTVNELKTYLGIEEHEYTIFKHFNYKVIKKAISEINQKADLSIEVKFDVKNGDDIVWFSIKKKTRTTIDVRKLITKATKQIPRQAIEDCAFMQLKEHGISHKKAKHIFDVFGLHEIQKVINEMQHDIEKIVNPAAFITKIFNSKEKERSKQIRVMGTRKATTSDFDKQELIVKHRKFVTNRIQELWDQLADDRKQSLDAAYDQWIIKQNLPAHLIGRAILHPLFLEQVLLLPQEKNFDEWVNRKN